MEQYGYREMPKQGLSPLPRPSLAGLAGNWQSYRSVFPQLCPWLWGQVRLVNAEPFKGGVGRESEGHGGMNDGKSLPICAQALIYN